MRKKLFTDRYAHRLQIVSPKSITVIPTMAMLPNGRYDIMPGMKPFSSSRPDTAMKILILSVQLNEVFPSGPVVKNLPANAGEGGSIPESGRSPGERTGNPL